jgi:hypothetical protein
MRFKVFDNLFTNYDVSKQDHTIFDMIEELQNRVKVLEENYQGALIDIKRLEEENVETTNTLYEIMHSVDAVDARIDILAEHCGITEDV